jgi:hypothetical protein
MPRDRDDVIPPDTAMRGKANTKLFGRATASTAIAVPELFYSRKIAAIDAVYFPKSAVPLIKLPQDCLQEVIHMTGCGRPLIFVRLARDRDEIRFSLLVEGFGTRISIG